MPSTRPLPTVIGPTENALRALLTSTLSSTRISTYPAWVVANAASNAGPTWRHEAADALKIELDGVAQIIDGLRAADLLDDGEALTDAGAVELAAARLAVAATTSRLTDGISDEEQETARLVLDRIRGNAEELLRHDAQRRSEGTPHQDSDGSGK
jgi:hypothetical protein